MPGAGLIRTEWNILGNGSGFPPLALKVKYNHWADIFALGLLLHHSSCSSVGTCLPQLALAFWRPKSAGALLAESLSNQLVVPLLKER